MEKDLFIDRILALTAPLEPINTGRRTILKPIQGIRCVAFDFYGTMFISAVGEIGIDEEQQQKSSHLFIEALKDSGFTIVNNGVGEKGIAAFEETIGTYTREATRDQGIEHPEPNIIAVWLDVLEKLAASGEIRGKTNLDIAARFGIEFEFRINDIWPAPELKPVLQKLKERNLELGIISNSQYYTPLAFEALMGSSPPEFGFNANLLVWSYQAELKKPSTELYRLFIEAAEKENLQPHEVLYVGNDIRKDVQPAKELGMRTALYVGDQRSIRHQPEDLEKEVYRPDLIIDKLGQINECLAG